jgi:hypothetical protein
MNDFKITIPYYKDIEEYKTKKLEIFEYCEFTQKFKVTTQEDVHYALNGLEDQILFLSEHVENFWKWNPTIELVFQGDLYLKDSYIKFTIAGKIMNINLRVKKISNNFLIGSLDNFPLLFREMFGKSFFFETQTLPGTFDVLPIYEFVAESLHIFNDIAIGNYVISSINPEKLISDKFQEIFQYWILIYDKLHAVLYKLRDFLCVAFREASGDKFTSVEFMSEKSQYDTYNDWANVYLKFNIADNEIVIHSYYELQIVIKNKFGYEPDEDRKYQIKDLDRLFNYEFTKSWKILSERIIDKPLNCNKL